MLKRNKVKHALREGVPVFGLFCSIPSSLMVEMAGCAGFDFVIIDTEHAAVNPETVENMIRAAEVVGMTPFVRVTEPASGPILRALDAGAQGVVVPHICTRAEAELAVKSSRYFPEGTRSLNGGRPAAFGGVNLHEYIKLANREVMVIPMVEDREGVVNLEEILTVPGLDMVLEGAADLSQSYGVPWQTRSAEVTSAVEEIHRKAVQCEVVFCALPRAADDFVKWTGLGVKAFVLGDDRGISFRAMRDLLRSVKKETGLLQSVKEEGDS